MYKIHVVNRCSWRLLNRIGAISRKGLSILLLLLLSAQTYADSAPQVLGYGVRGCSDYLTTYEGWKKGDEQAIFQYLRYQDWVTGLTTGLSLATATDVLQGVEVESVMRRVRIQCEEHPTDDFFTATMALIKLLSGLH